jgi:hypothetical protein
MTESTPNKLSLNRETVRQLDQGDLGKVAGGQLPGQQTNTANTCPVSACVCVTGKVCYDLSLNCLCSTGTL